MAAPRGALSAAVSVRKDTTGRKNLCGIIVKKNEINKNELFAHVPVPKALAAMAVPTIISQMVNLIYNMVDGFFIGRTGNSYMMAATSLILTLTMLHVALANLFGVGGGSLVARLMGVGKEGKARRVSALCVYGAAAAALLYALLVALFLNPILRFLGASDATIGYARSYTIIVIIVGSLPALLSLVLSHLLRNAGYASKASFGLSMGGVLNVALDPLFMFVLFPAGYEVEGAAAARRSRWRCWVIFSKSRRMACAGLNNEIICL